MSDTSLVFNLLGRDNVSRVLGVIRGAFTSAGRTAETAMDKANISTERLDRQIQETERHLAELNAEFAATGDKTLFGKMARDRSLLTQLRRVRTEIQGANDDAASARGVSSFLDQFRDGASQIGRMASQLGSFGSTVGAVIGPLGTLIGVIGGVAAALAAIGPATALAGGAIGSLPAILGGGIAAIGTLKLGLFGLGDEYKRLTTVQGGSSGAAKQAAAANRAVEQAARAVARAERDVKDAQKDALEAQQAINEARESASKRMRDQALDLKQARRDQADAADAVAEAEAGVANAMKTGDPIQIEKAKEALEDAQLAAERAKNRVDDLTEANAENAKKGVEGSDEVVAAKKREQDARQRVADAIEGEKEAEERLADARKQQASGGGGGGGAGQQITKLAPAARAFLNTVLGLRPAFEALRLDVQEKLFAGLSTRLQTLAERWMPQLHKTLGNFATTFNGIASTFFDSAGKKTFIDNMAAGAESARKALGEVGKAAAGPLVDAFGRLARASGPFVEKLGHLIGDLIIDFSNWIKKLDESGKLDKFFKGAADTLGKVWDVGKKVFKVIGQVIGIIFGQSKKAGDSALDSASNALTKVSDWLSKPENQKQIRDFVDKIFEWGRAFKDVMAKVESLKGVVGAAFKVIGFSIDAGKTMINDLRARWNLFVGVVKWIGANGAKAWNGVKNGISSAYNWVVSKGGALVGWVKGLAGRIGKAAAGMWDGIKNAFRNALNWIIARWNNLSLPMPAFLGGPIDLPNIPFLARGGIVPATPGGRLAVLGEGGQDEAVIPLPRGGGMASVPRGGGDADLNLKVKVDLDFGDSEFGRMMTKAVRTQPAVAAAIKDRIKVTVTT